MKKNIIIVKLQLFRDIVRRQLGLVMLDQVKPSNFELPNTKSILFIRNDAKLGDAIVSSGVISKIRKYRPDIRIIVMTTPGMTGLFKDGFHVDEVIHLNKRPSYSEIKAVCSRLGPVDVAVSLNADMKMKDIYLHRCLQSQINIGLDPKVKLVNKNISSQVNSLHYANKFDYIATILGIEEKPEPYIVPLKKDALFKAESFIASNDIQRFTLFNPFGSGSTRKLNKNNILRIIQKVQQSHCALSVVLLSSPETRDEVEKMGVIDNIKVFHFDESNSIYDAIAIISLSQNVITVDTSIVHIAAGLQKKQIAIYKNDKENYQNWGPNSELAKSVFATQDINELDTELLQIS